MNKQIVYLKLFGLIFFLQNAFSQKLVDIKMSNCDADSKINYMYENRLISKELINDTLILNLGIVRNCSFKPSIELNMKKDSLYIEIQNSSDIFSSCLCCFELKLKITEIKETNFKLVHKFDSYIYQKDSFISQSNFQEIEHHKNKYCFPLPTEINDFQPLNQYTIDSLKVGPWVNQSTFGNNKSLTKIYYRIQKGKSQALWEAYYNEKDELVYICGTKGENDEGIPVKTCVNYEEYVKIFSEYFNK